jgi:hypothetical protein
VDERVTALPGVHQKEHTTGRNVWAMPVCDREGEVDKALSLNCRLWPGNFYAKMQNVNLIPGKDKFNTKQFVLQSLITSDTFIPV